MKTKIIVSVLLCVLISFVGVNNVILVKAETNVEASENYELITRMDYISSYSTTLSISDLGKASVTGLVRGKASTTSTYVKCTLQIDRSGTWVDVKSWEASGSGSGATIAESYQLYSHGTYRVYMECRGNTETKTTTSAYRTY